MNILIVVDKHGSAIDILARPLLKYLDHLNIKILPVHPKRNDIETLHEAQVLMNWADVIDIHYWKSGEVLKTTFPTEWQSKPKILFHMNPYDYDKSDWKDYKAVVVGNTSIQMNIAGSYLVPYGIDLDFYTFNEDYSKEKIVNMSVARIESKKGILEVARACEDLGYKLTLIGRVSEPEYMREVIQCKSVEFYENVSDKDKKSIYYKSAVHVCNSVDNFESGTLPILENMACGIPVLTRNVGHVCDINNGQNMVVRSGAKDDIEDLKTELKSLMENLPLREKIREKAWDTIKNGNDRTMARRINRLYYKIYGDNDKWFSVIVPTFDRPELLIKNLASIEAQNLRNIEVVVIDSGNISAEPIVKKFRSLTKLPIKYIRFDNNDEYTLPKARNLGVQKSIGEIILLLDDRLVMDRNALINFQPKVRRKTWLWGMKDESEKGFVENFSCVLREDLVKGGLFNERVNVYGGQTQEIRTRFESNGFSFEFVRDAKAKSAKAGHRSRKRSSIIKAKEILRELYE